jgi:hypothetical protein
MRRCAKPLTQPDEAQSRFTAALRALSLWKYVLRCLFQARLVNPGFPGEPFVIGRANRAMGTREEDGTALKAVAIRFDAGRNCAPRLRAFDQDCTHVDPPVLVPSSVILLWRQVDTY